MKIATSAGLVGFLLALGTLNASATAAATVAPVTTSQKTTVESRLNRLTEAIRDRETQLPDAPLSLQDKLVALGWANGGRGGWVNVNPWRNWRNGWADRGGFLNRPGWHNGGWRNGGFRNHRNW